MKIENCKLKISPHRAERGVVADSLSSGERRGKSSNLFPHLIVFDAKLTNFQLSISNEFLNDLIFNDVNRCLKIEKLGFV